MAQIIGLPKLSPTMEEGVLVKWVKHEGDAVEPGDLVAEVETDKANMDFNLEDEGVLLKLLVEEGATVRLGAPVAILGEKGEDISALIAEAQKQMEAAPEPAPSEPAAQPAPSAPAPTAPASSPSAAPTPVAERPTAPITGAKRTGRLLASPLAKTLALELGIDLRQVAGSGPGGRIVERDVRAVAERGGADSSPQLVDEPPPSSTALAVRPPATQVPAPIPPTDEYMDKPLSNMRKRIAERMQAAKRDVPHFYLTRDFNVAPLLDFRKRLNQLLGDRGKVSVNDLIIKGAALALRRVPDCNTAFVGNAIRYYANVHIGVAVATDRGLLTPVIRNADLKGIGVIAKEVKDLAERARDRDIKAHEIQGSTFTVSNLGMFGIKHFEAIINPPEAAILAVGTIQESPVIRDDKIVVGKHMSLTMSCDHRVIDGALGARYLSELVDLLEKPESLAL